jgi:kinesin family member C1
MLAKWLPTTESGMQAPVPQPPPIKVEEDPVNTATSTPIDTPRSGSNRAFRQGLMRARAQSAAKSRPRLIEDLQAMKRSLSRPHTPPRGPAIPKAPVSACSLQSLGQLFRRTVSADSTPEPSSEEGFSSGLEPLEELRRMNRFLRKENARLKSSATSTDIMERLADAEAAKTNMAIRITNLELSDRAAESQISALNMRVEQLRGERTRMQSELMAQEERARSVIEEMEATIDELTQARDAARQDKERLLLEVVQKDEEMAELRRELQHVQQSTAEALAAKTTETEEASARAQAALEESARLREMFQSVEEARRQLQEQVLDLRGAVRVIARVRPALPQEEVTEREETKTHFKDLSQGAGGLARSASARVLEAPTDMEHAALFQYPVPEAAGEEKTLQVCMRPGRGVGGYGVAAEGAKHMFEFQRAFGPLADQASVFHEVQGVVSAAIDGKRACIFAYGQTGAGKTHTMFGGATEDERGIVPRAVEHLFSKLAQLSEHGWTAEVETEFLEVYNDSIRDLFAPTSASSSASKVAVKVDRDGSSRVTGHKTVPVSNAPELLELLHTASLGRTTASTAMNATSSRSHSIFTLKVSTRHVGSGQSREGILNLVDLAGSERIAKSGSVHDAKLKAEAVAINTSLTVLGNVLRAMGDNDRRSKASKGKKSDAGLHIPFRDSTLTRVLQPSLSDGAKAVMIVNLSPLHSSAQESLCSLRFAEAVAKHCSTS